MTRGRQVRASARSLLLVDSDTRWVSLVALGSVSREPCSKRKFQSHPTVPPGRLIELTFAAVSRE